MSDSTICFAILAVTVVVFVWDYFPVAVVALGVSLSLWATGVLDIHQSLAGFGDSAVIFIAALFVVSEALDATGVTAWLGQELINRAGDSRTRLMIYMMALVALLTALISVNGAVAALLPVVVVMAIRLGRATSQLLLPLAFAAHAGSLLVLTGTPVNVVVSEAAANAGVSAAARTSARMGVAANARASAAAGSGSGSHSGSGSCSSSCSRPARSVSQASTWTARVRICISAHTRASPVTMPDSAIGQMVPAGHSADFTKLPQSPSSPEIGPAVPSAPWTPGMPLYSIRTASRFAVLTNASTTYATLQRHETARRIAPTAKNGNR